MISVYKRELKSYFTSYTGYIFTAFMLLTTGVYSWYINYLNQSPEFEYILFNLNFIYLIAVPILTMKTISDERRQKTDMLLYSLPLSGTAIVLGKYFCTAHGSADTHCRHLHISAAAYDVRYNICAYLLFNHFRIFPYGSSSNIRRYVCFFTYRQSDSSRNINLCRTVYKLPLINNCRRNVNCGYNFTFSVFRHYIMYSSLYRIHHKKFGIRRDDRNLSPAFADCRIHIFPDSF